ncbi:hypothetical protein [Chamaesiphon sp. GL140_3_metabinner_50]|nr:hypothetical protein [Chamaesiphon sp. GL140_3_metabinner_50]
MYEVNLQPDAQEIYAKADKALAEKIIRCLEQLRANSLIEIDLQSR